MADKQHPAGEMSFLEHLEELRWAILKSVLAIFFGMIVCFFFADDILKFLISPTRLENLRVELIFFRPAGMFTVKINVALACGFALALPVVLYQLWNFISPGLLPREKKYIPYVIFFSTLLFLLGAAFAFFVLIPVMVRFFIEIGIEGVKAQWDIGYYIGLVIKMVLIMGLVFEMPLLIGFLTWIRILSPRLLKQGWRMGMVIIFILAAVITPTGDPYTQTLVAIPLVILYFVSLGVSMLVARGREEPEAEVFAEPASSAAPAAPQEPASPTYPRGLYNFTGPESGMRYWPEEDYIFEYDKEETGDTSNRVPPDGPADGASKENGTDGSSDGAQNQAAEGAVEPPPNTDSAELADGERVKDQEGNPPDRAKPPS
jgi:sec-independent protein translocase protein TatC